MNSTLPEIPDDHLRNIHLEEGYAYIVIEYDQQTVSFPELFETIELTGTRVLETKELRAGTDQNRSILFKLDIQDVRDVMLSLSKHPLMNVTGYNSKSNTNSIRRTS
jgi:hypothetical protein